MRNKVSRENKRIKSKFSPFRTISFYFGLIVILYGLAGCNHFRTEKAPIEWGEEGQVGKCLDFFAALDQTIADNKARDVGAFRIEGYPYLRTNRFVGSFRNDLTDGNLFEAWVQRLKDLDRHARYYEIENLSVEESEALKVRTATPGIYETVLTCGDLLASSQLKTPESRAQLKKRAEVPDEYEFIKRLAGLYPLPILFISDGVKRWQKSARESFSNYPPNNSHLLRYIPPVQDTPAKNPAELMQMGRRDVLGIPIYSPEAERALFEVYSPVWEVETRGEYDRIGNPEWASKSRLEIDIHHPVAFQLLSYTRFGGQILTQLNYIIWFPARPKGGFVDLLAGRIDGVNYRVTLDVDGQPLLYETVHNCGCYLKFYTTQKILPKITADCEEPPLLLHAPAMDPATERMVISLESGTHYVNHLYPVKKANGMPGEVYAVSDYDNLRSLPVAGTDSRRSMFGEDGIVPGTERLERWLLWPTGVASPGAMRQWGRHAVAFMGERHFDDPYLLQQLFEYPQD